MDFVFCLPVKDDRQAHNSETYCCLSVNNGERVSCSLIFKSRRDG